MRRHHKALPMGYQFRAWPLILMMNPAKTVRRGGVCRQCRVIVPSLAAAWCCVAKARGGG